jgi:hypothetical protein
VADSDVLKQWVVAEGYCVTRSTEDAMNTVLVGYDNSHRAQAALRSADEHAGRPDGEHLVTSVALSIAD